MISKVKDNEKVGDKLGTNQPVHWFLGGKGLGIQQGTSVWVGSPKSYVTLTWYNTGVA